MPGHLLDNPGKLEPFPAVLRPMIGFPVPFMAVAPITTAILSRSKCYCDLHMVYDTVGAVDVESWVVLMLGVLMARMLMMVLVLEVLVVVLLRMLMMVLYAESLLEVLVVLMLSLLMELMLNLLEICW